MLEIMLLPFLACLILTGIHVYLGIHIVERGVIFVDLALAQIAVLGASVGMLVGFDMGSTPNYFISLGFSLIGAGIFALSRLRQQSIPQEAIIGICYVVAAALMVLVMNFNAEAVEHLRASLVGDILLISKAELQKMFLIYLAIGLFHYLFYQRFWFISQNPQLAFEKKIRVRFWDFLFYVTLAVVVTSSVKIAGVLVVFSYLVIPAVCVMILTKSFMLRLLIGWLIGILASMIGALSSYYFDLPTGATIVCAFAIIMIILMVIHSLFKRANIFSN